MTQALIEPYNFGVSQKVSNHSERVSKLPSTYLSYVKEQMNRDEALSRKVVFEMVVEKVRIEEEWNKNKQKSRKKLWKPFLLEGETLLSDLS